MNIELQALSTMLDRQDFNPIRRGEITLDQMVTTDGATVLNFILQYKHTTDGAARYPTLDVVRNRFENTGVELPDPAPKAADLGSLVYETRLQKLKSELNSHSTILDQLSGSTDPLEGLGAVIRALRQCSQAIQRAKHVSLSDTIQDIIADYDAGVLLPHGIPWPWPSLQEVTKGIQRKEFVVIAGRPKSRKTFVALCIAAFAFQYHNARVLFVSPEMPARQVILRFIAFIAAVRYTEFKSAALGDAELDRLLEIAEQYGRTAEEDEDAYSFRLHSALGLEDGCLPPSFDVVQGTNKSVTWIETQIELFQPDIVIVDSFYRLKHEGGKARDADWKQVTGISRALKDLCMESNIALIGTHQMNRESEGKIGSVGNLALADAVGQDADLIMRVITGKVESVDHSALVVLGGREVPFDGVLIRNQPCFDFDEVAPITSKKTVMDLMNQEEDEQAKEEATRTKVKAKRKKSGKNSKLNGSTHNKKLQENIMKLDTQGDGSIFGSQSDPVEGDDNDS